MMALTYVTIFSHLFQCCVVNMQSARNKVGDINDILTERCLDFMIMTEFWMKPDDPDYYLQIGDIDYNNYNIINNPRPKKRGGGIALIYNNKYRVKNVTVDFRPKSFEFSVLNVQSLFTIVVIYRPPLAKTRQDFVTELDDLMALLSLDYNRVLLCGDVNFHFEREDNFTDQFSRLMKDYCYEYHVGGKPTHRLGGSLDVVCTHDLVCDSLLIEDAQLSDHFLVYFNLGILGRRNIPGSNIVNKQPRYYKYRDYSSLACDEFRNSIALYCDQLCYSEDNAEFLADSLFKKLSDDLDQFAPSVSRKTKKKRRSDFIYSREVSDAKRLRRGYERQYRKHGREIDKQLLKSQRYKVRDLALKQKAGYVKNKIAAGNCKVLFDQVKSLSAPRSNSLPSDYPDNLSLACAFAEYFKTKVDKIVGSFGNSDAPPIVHMSNSGKAEFNEFDTLTTTEIEKLRRVKCSTLDIIPRTHFMTIWPLMLGVVGKLVNSSLSSGVFPSRFKEAQITPLLKSDSLDVETLSSLSTCI